MEIVGFTDQYELAAVAHSTTADELRSADERRAHPRPRWLALSSGDVLGSVEAFRRPDRRTFVSFFGMHNGAYRPLTAAVASAVGGRIRTVVDDGETEIMSALGAAGYSIELSEDSFRIRFETALLQLRRRDVPPGFSIIGADQADEARLFTLDTTLRQDVPGTDGWRGDRNWFQEELADSPPFDPTAYLVAVDDHTGEYAGLVRMWRNPSGPRLGLIGVARQYRTTTIAAVLLARSLAAAAEWGHDSFVTETSQSNTVIHPRLNRIEAQRTARRLHLRWRGVPRPPDGSGRGTLGRASGTRSRPRHWVRPSAQA